MREADIHVPYEVIAAMGFDITPAGYREADMRDLTLIRCEEASSIVAATYSKPVDETLDDAEHVEWWERRGSDVGGVTYLYEVVVPDLPEAMAETDLDVEAVSMDEDGCALTMVGSQDAIRRSAAAYEEVDAPADISLLRLADYDGPTDHLDALTSRQREVLETAHDLGYFEVPREATAEDVAERLGLDRATVTEHLQRAERNLLSSVLSG